MRKLSGDVRLEARGKGHALLILRSSTGETFGIERSPAQLAALRGAIDEIEAAEAARQAALPPSPAPEPEPQPPASTEAPAETAPADDPAQI